MSTATDKKELLRWLDKNGWRYWQDELTGTWQAEHERASHAVSFGGKHGWTLRIIRRECEKAIGRDTPMSRKKAEKAAMKQSAEDRRQEKEAHLRQVVQNGCPPLERAQHIQLARRKWVATNHFKQRMAERGVGLEQIRDSIKDPVTVIRGIANGRPCARFVGEEVVVVVDYASSSLLTTYRTDWALIAKNIDDRHRRSA